jgi:hypothetical protein
MALHGIARWTSIGAHDGFFRGVVTSDEPGPPVWICGHRHPNSTYAKSCARRNAARLTAKEPKA